MMIRKILPNLIIAGVNKAGTTSLFTYLKIHPEICASNIKETCYFLPLRYGKPCRPLDEYHQYFQHCSGFRYVMESTPGYFYGGYRVAKAIKEIIADVRVVIVLREPISRMFSFYRFQKSRLLLPNEMTFESYIENCIQMPVAERGLQENNPYWGLNGGFYADYVSDWSEVFAQNLEIIFFDNLKANPTECVKSLCNWLSLDSSIYDKIELSVENQSMNYRNSRLQKQALFINTMAESVFRLYPKMKHQLRDLYYKINGQRFDEKISLETRNLLNGIFLPYNLRLKAQLVELGYLSLPDWLAA